MHLIINVKKTTTTIQYSSKTKKKHNRKIILLSTAFVKLTTITTNPTHLANPKPLSLTSHHANCRGCKLICGQFLCNLSAQLCITSTKQRYSHILTFSDAHTITSRFAPAYGCLVCTSIYIHTYAISRGAFHHSTINHKSTIS